MKRILIVCTGNTCRSPMAAGICKKLSARLGVEAEVLSGGLAGIDGAPASPQAVEAMAEIGVDISGHRSHQVQAEELLAADKIYVMTQQHKSMIAGVLPQIAERITVAGISDPFGQPVERYRQCRDALTAFFLRELTEGGEE